MKPNESNKDHLLAPDADVNAQKEYIQTLLLSEGQEEVALALELLKGGGVPAEMMTAVFIVYKFSPDKKNKKKALELLKSYGSPTLQDALQNKVRKLAKNMTDHLYDFVSGTELTQWKINFYIQLFVDDWVNGLQKNNLNTDIVRFSKTEERRDFLRYFIKRWWNPNNQRYSWNEKLSFELYGDLLFDQPYIHTLVIDYRFNSKHAPTRFPEGISKMEQLEYLFLATDLHKTGFPEELFQLKNLKKLYLSSCNLKSIPTGLKELSQLEILSLEKNQLEMLPEDLVTMNQLKELNLKSAFSNPDNIDIEALKKAMPNCNIIT